MVRTLLKLMENEAVRKLTVTGRGETYYLTIPRGMIKNLKWKRGEKKIVSQNGNKIVIKDWQRSE